MRKGRGWKRWDCGRGRKRGGGGLLGKWSGVKLGRKANGMEGPDGEREERGENRRKRRERAGEGEG